jgi:hypothetical protein
MVWASCAETVQGLTGWRVDRRIAVTRLESSSMIRILAAVTVAIVMAGSAIAQGWGNLDQLLRSTLSTTGDVASSYWLPDAIDPVQATEAIGIAYIPIPGSAGSTSISVAYFQKTARGFTAVAAVQQLFGQAPREALFLPDRIEITTNMLGPNDARCCPNKETRWVIDRTTLVAVAQN